MTNKNELFEDNMTITSIDKEGKVFDKVSRIEANADYSKCNITLDINSDLYPISKDSLYKIAITKSVYTDGSPSPNAFSYDVFSKKNTLIEKYDYVMYGKIFKYSEEGKGIVSIYISFGGLLMGITGDPNYLINLKMDDRVYLLLKKIN